MSPNSKGSDETALPEPLLITYAISTLFSCAGPYISYNVKRDLLTNAPNEDSNQPAHPRSLIIRGSHDETLHTLLSKMRS